MYSANGLITQPSAHIEAALVKAAATFKITGRRGKTYKDVIQSSVFVTPLDIPHALPDGIRIPEDLDYDADKMMYLDMRPVVVQRARVVRTRPALKKGWTLDFDIEVIDDQLPPNVLNDILLYAGKSVGIGDFRPRFGRFLVSKFAV